MNEPTKPTETKEKKELIKPYIDKSPVCKPYKRGDAFHLPYFQPTDMDVITDTQQDK